LRRCEAVLRLEGRPRTMRGASWKSGRRSRLQRLAIPVAVRTDRRAVILSRRQDACACQSDRPAGLSPRCAGADNGGQPGSGGQVGQRREAADATRATAQRKRRAAALRRRESPPCNRHRGKLRPSRFSLAVARFRAVPSAHQSWPRPCWRAARRALEEVEKVVTGPVAGTARLRLMCDTVAPLDG
jgi:hypothetical protein